MDYLPSFALFVHIISTTFWAGSSFVEARDRREVLGTSLFPAQMGAAAFAIASGGYLFSIFHPGVPTGTGILLALGALAAIIGAGVQGLAYRARRLGASGFLAGHGARGMAAGLLGLALLCMAIYRAF